MHLRSSVCQSFQKRPQGLVVRDMRLLVPDHLSSVVQIREGNGAPDGIRCDAKGNVWVSTGEGINIFAPDGDMIAKILTPV